MSKRIARTTKAGTYYHVTEIGHLDAKACRALDAIADAAIKKIRLTPKQRVIAKYPHAIVWDWRDKTVIYSNRYNTAPHGNQVLGSGKSARQAWADAASKL